MNIRLVKRKKLSNNVVSKSNFVYIFVLSIFLAGIIIGASYFHNINSDENTIVYIKELFKNAGDFKNTDISLHTVIMLENIKVVLLFWIIGLSLIGTPFLLAYIGYRGFVLGFTLTAVFSYSKNIIVPLIGLFVVNILYIPQLIMMMTSSIKFAKNVILSSKNMKAEFVRHSVICLICALLILAISILETYINIQITRYL